MTNPIPKAKTPPNPPRNGKSCRRKGDGFEREFVNFMLEGDIQAQRVPLSGATAFHKGDVVLSPRCIPNKLTGECKRRKKLPAIFAALGEHDFLAFRGDRGETMVCISARMFRDLLQ